MVIWVLISKWPKESRIPVFFPIGLFFIHLLFTVLYFHHTLHNSTDAWEYYHDPSFRGNADSWAALYGTGIRFIFFLVYPLSQWLHLSYPIVFMLFSVIGYGGILVAMRFWERYFEVEKRIALIGILILCWPSLHFWTSAIGKDGLAFLGIAAFFYGLSRKNWRGGVWVFAALLLLSHIRIHMALLCIGSTALGYLVWSIQMRKLNAGFWLVLISGSILFPLLLLFILPKVDVFDASWQGVIESLSAMQHRFAQTRHGLDLREMSVLSRYLTFMFRPLPGDSDHLLGYGLMAQNLLLILLITGALLRWIRNPKLPMSIQAWSMLFYFTVGTFIFSQAMSNLGLIDREKIMFFLPLATFIWSQWKDFKVPFVERKLQF